MKSVNVRILFTPIARVVPRRAELSAAADVGDAEDEAAVQETQALGLE